MESMKFPVVGLVCAALAVTTASAQVKITATGNKISVQIAGQPFTDFYTSGEAFHAQVTKPYLWPLRAPSGTAITRAWPMEDAADEAGEKKPQRNGPPAMDHLHQRGAWFAHEAVNRIDFWNNEWSYYAGLHRKNLGRMNLRGAPKVTSGTQQGTIDATFEWTRMEENHPILTEHRVMTFYAEPKLRVFDLDVTLTAIEEVTFGDSKDGAFGIRLRPVLQEDKGVSHIVNSDGLVGEKALWGKPANWCDYSGQIGDEKVGVAIFDHPQNPRHPQRWHARAYGLFAVNPWGLSAFTGDKTQDGSMKLDAGKSVRLRYRVVIHEGDAKAAGIAGLYARYAAGK
jgi:hypothetical protein